MAQAYIPLSYTGLASNARYCRPSYQTQKVTLESPAVAVMTDLERVMAVTIGPDASIETANQCMIAAGVRLLFVVDGEHHILGLITASDILGEKPVKHLQRVGGAFGEILVHDIMTSQENLDVLQLHEVHQARVGDVVATLKYFGRQHALVVEMERDRVSQKVRGIFSATQIGRQLGMNVAPGEIASTFAELEAILIS